MNVSITDFKNALSLFFAEFIGTLDTPMQKFAAGFAYAANGAKIDSMLAQYTNENGIINTDVIRELVGAGMKQCGGSLEVPVNFGLLGAFGAPPKTIRININDVDKFFTQTLPAVANNIPQK